MKTILILVLALFSVSSFARVYDCSVTVANNDEKLRETFKYDTSVEDAHFGYLDAKSSRGASLSINYRIVDRGDSGFMNISAQDIDSATDLNREMGKTTKLQTTNTIGGGAGIDWKLEMSCTVISE